MKRHSTQKSTITCLVSSIVLLATSCHESVFPSDEAQFERFERAIDKKNFSTAMRLLDDAALNAKSQSDEQIVEYNKAIIEILSGKCDDAVTRMKSIIENAAEQRSTTFPRFPTPDDKISHDIHLGAHYLIATGLLCPTRPFPAPSKEKIEEAIQHLIHLIQYGEDHRNLLNFAYAMLFRPCQTFISADEPKNNAYESALSLAGTHGIVKEFTLCPHMNRWFSFQARQHEFLSLFLKLRAIERTFRIDDSSRLPYAHIQVVLYKAPAPGEKLGDPLATYEMPAPPEPPSPDAPIFLRHQIEIPPIEASETGTYLVQFRTKDNGEARITPVFTKKVNCAYSDDDSTYTQDFVQIPVKLKQGGSLTMQVICPSRPDLYQISLAPRQSVIVSLRSTDPKLVEDAIAIAVKDGFGRSYAANQPADRDASESNREDSSTNPHDSEGKIRRFAVFKGIFRRSLSFEEHFYTLHILIENDLDTTNTIYLTLSSKDKFHGIRHSITMNASLPCGKSHAPRIVERTLPLDKLNRDEVYFAPPEWLCPNDIVRYTPTLPAGDALFNSTLTTSLIGRNEIPKNDFNFTAYLTLPPENKPFISETSTLQLSSDWHGPHDLFDYILQKPMMPHTIIELETQAHAKGFAFMTITPTSSGKDRENENQKQDKNDEKQQNDPNKRDKNPSKDDNAPTPNPEKPSQTPQTPQGQGDDTEGNESTPTPDADPGNAHQFDPNQSERDYVDALLDSIEQGQLEMPIQGQTHEKLPKKDW